MSHEHVNFDVVLETVGEFGRFQRVIYFLLCLPAVITASITLANVFTTAQPDFRCFIPGCDSNHSIYADAFEPNGFAHFTIPKNNESILNHGFDGCHMFKHISNNSSSNDTTCTSEYFDTSQTVLCETWKFDEAYFKSTIVTTWNLSCLNESWLIPVSKSLFFVSVIFAAPFFGHLADTKGRKPTLMLALCIMSISSIILAASPNFIMYIIFNMISGFGQMGTYQTAFILGLELVGKSRRVFCGIVANFFFIAGELLLTLSAYLLRDWRFILVSIAIPSMFFLCYWPILPESPRWLLYKRRFNQANQEITRMAKWNGKNFSGLKDSNMIEDSFKRNENSSEHPLGLLKSPILLRQTIVLCYTWFSVTMIYYGLSLNSSSLAGNFYLNFVLVSSVEIPGCLLSYLTLIKFGRQVSCCVFLLVGGLSCVVSSFLPNGLQIVTFLLGKMNVSAVFATIYLSTSELYPTSVRTVFLGLCSMCGRVGSVLSPLVASLSPFWLPMVFFGLNAIISGVCIGIFLAETKGRELPETIKDVENFYCVDSSYVRCDTDEEIQRELLNDFDVEEFEELSES